ncbi:hypothetical protein V2O64_16320 [Verrucomicrobiaceae bacterium 227]
MKKNNALSKKQFFPLALGAFLFSVLGCKDSEDAGASLKEVSSSKKINLTRVRGETQDFSQPKDSIEEVSERSDFKKLLEHVFANKDSLSIQDGRKALRLLAEKVDAKTFESVWTILAEMPESSFISNLQSNILTNAGNRGYREVAFKTIMELSGPGNVRNGAIAMIFEGGSFLPEGQTPNFNEITSLFEKLEFDQERRFAAGGVSTQLAYMRNLDGIEFFLKSPNHELRESAIRALSLYSYSLSADVPELSRETRLDSVIKLAKNEQQINVSDLLSSVAQMVGSTTEAIEIYQKTKEQSENQGLDLLSKEARESLASSLVKGNPQAGMEIIAEDPSEVDFFKDSMSSWINDDSNAAHSWFEERVSSLSSDQRDAASQAFSLAAVHRGELETAQEWMMKIGDEKKVAEIKDAILERK